MGFKMGRFKLYGKPMNVRFSVPFLERMDTALKLCGDHPRFQETIRNKQQLLRHIAMLGLNRLEVELKADRTEQTDLFMK